MIISDTVIVSLISTAGAVMIAGFGVLATMLNGVRKTVVGQKETILMLEKNTNSIKDALVKKTGEAAHAQGVAEGLEKARIEANS